MSEQQGKIYFASDFHLGVPDADSSRKREACIIRWLDAIRQDAAEIFLLGDVFDFWFEYKHAIPKGFVRLQGKIAEIVDGGTPVHWFTGNHDMWIFNYLPEELGVQLHRSPLQMELNGKKFFIGHGDGLGPHDRGYKFIKKIFANKFCQWMFARLHPNFGIAMAHFWSGRSRLSNMDRVEHFMGKDSEWLMAFCEQKLKTEHFDYFIFGHRHLPLDLKVGSTSRYINLGDWVNHRSYAVFDGESLELKYFEKADAVPVTG